MVAETQAGMAVVGAAHRLLDKANIIVDSLLPPEKWDHVVLDHGEYVGNGKIYILLSKIW